MFSTSKILSFCLYSYFIICDILYGAELGRGFIWSLIMLYYFKGIKV